MWVKLDDQFDDHPKIAGLTDGAFRLHVSALTWSARKDTEGKIPAGVLVRLQSRTPAKFARELVAARVWHAHGHTCPTCEQPADGEYVVHDYLVYNPLNEAARERRKAKARKAAAARWGARDRGTHDAPTEHAHEHDPSMPGGCLEMPPLPVTDVIKSVVSPAEPSTTCGQLDTQQPDEDPIRWATDHGYPPVQAGNEYHRWIAWSTDNRRPITPENWRRWLDRVTPEPPYTGPPTPTTPIPRCQCGDVLLDAPAGSWCATCDHAPPTLTALEGGRQ